MVGSETDGSNVSKNVNEGAVVVAVVVAVVASVRGGVGSDVKQWRTSRMLRWS